MEAENAKFLGKDKEKLIEEKKKITILNCSRVYLTLQSQINDPQSGVALLSKVVLEKQNNLANDRDYL